MSFTSTFSEEKENGEPSYSRSKLSPEMRYAGSSASSGRGSPARGFRSAPGYREDGGESGVGITRERPASSLPQPSGPNGGAESWKRAAEVTSQLKARIEQMKASQAQFPSPIFTY
jgi:cytoskeleton-associated protein 5